MFPNVRAAIGDCRASLTRARPEATPIWLNVGRRCRFAEAAFIQRVPVPEVLELSYLDWEDRLQEPWIGALSVPNGQGLLVGTPFMAGAPLMSSLAIEHLRRDVGRGGGGRLFRCGQLVRQREVKRNERLGHRLALRQIEPLHRGHYPKGDLKRYERIPGVHVGPVVKSPLFEGILQPSQIKPGGPTKPCRAVTWDGTAAVKQSSAGSTYGLATLGRYVLDKLGEDAQQMGITYAPFRAHFEPSTTGKALIDAHIVRAPALSHEGSMFMSKDADGHIKAGS